MKIAAINAFQVYDSRGCPTVEAEVSLDDGSSGSGIVPSGRSTGQFEAHELRDGLRDRFLGKSVFKAIEHIREEIAPALIGRDARDQRAIDHKLIELDGTENKGRLGANAILAVSMAAARAAANSQKLALYAILQPGETADLIPLPEIQIVGGGAHANWRSDVQDILLIATGARSYSEVMEITHNVYHTAVDLMTRRGAHFGVADEGGLWPQFPANEEAIKFVVEAIESAGYRPGVDASISLDFAASDLFDEQTQQYRFQLDNRSFSNREFADLIIDWCRRFPIVSIEDPMADTDWNGWEMVADALRDKIQIIGDDLFTTNAGRIRVGIERNVANAVLIKLNQIGTVTETIDAIRMTQKAGWLPVVSARSGETEDSFIAHLAVATNAGQIKVGSFSRGERTAKWNEIIRIERSLGGSARFLGSRIFTSQ